MPEIVELSLEDAIGNLANLYVQAFYQHRFLAELLGRDPQLQDLAKRHDRNSEKARAKADFIFENMLLFQIPFHVKQIAPFDPMKVKELSVQIRSAIGELNDLAKEDSNVKALLVRSKVLADSSSPSGLSEKKIHLRSEEYSIKYDADSSSTSKLSVENNEQRHEALETEGRSEPSSHVTTTGLSSEGTSEQTTCNFEDSQQPKVPSDVSKSTKAPPEEDADPTGGSQVVVDVGPMTSPELDPRESSCTNEELNTATTSTKILPSEEEDQTGSSQLPDVVAPEQENLKSNVPNEDQRSDVSDESDKKPKGNKSTPKAKETGNDFKVAVTRKPMKKGEMQSHRIRINLVVDISPRK